jgi:hypothetical protein
MRFIMSIFSPSDALGYHTKAQLERQFLLLDSEKQFSLDEIKKRVNTTFYGKNISNFLGYIPVVGTIQAIFLKTPLFIYLDSKLAKELQQHPSRKAVIQEIKDFHKWEKIRTIIEFFSFVGASLLLIPIDIIVTIDRNRAKHRICSTMY